MTISLASEPDACVDGQDQPPARSNERPGVITGFRKMTEGLPTVGVYGTVKAAHLDGDQYPDIVSTHWSDILGGIEAYTNDGDGTFSNASSGLPTDGIFGISDVGDIDGDGTADIVAPYEEVYSGSHEMLGLAIYLSDGGTGGEVNWTTGTSPATTGGYLGAAIGDFNGDGDSDIVASLQDENNMNNGRMRVWLGDGGTTWTPANTGLDTAGFWLAPDVADFNDDGYDDFVVGYGSGSGGLRCFAGSQTGAFASCTGNLPNSGVYFVTNVSDLDLDGDMDAIGARDNSGMSVMMGNGGSGGSMSWSNQNTGTSHSTWTYAGTASGKVDLDDYPDILAGESMGNGLVLHLNVWNEGSSIEWDRVRGDGLPEDSDYYGCAIIDLDLDGDGDIIAGSGAEEGIIVYETILIPSYRPKPDAGVEIDVLTNVTYELNGSLSTDDFAVVGYLWNLSTMPAGANVTLYDNASMTPRFRVDTQGDYVFNLTVMDDDGLWSSIEDSVIVHATPYPNARPKADAGPDATVTIFNLTQLDGTESWDDVGIDAYAWSMISKPSESLSALDNASIGGPVFIPDFVGDYLFELRVMDINATWSDPDTVTVKAVPQGIGPPVADAGPDKSFEQGEVVTLDGSASYDDTRIDIYDWEVAANPSGSPVIIDDVMMPNVTLPTIGLYTFTLGVMDNDRLWSDEMDYVNIEIVRRNKDPKAKIGAPDNNSVFWTSDDITFDASRSSDPEDGPLNFTWSSRPDGVISNEMVFTTQLSKGDLIVNLTVRDDHNRTDTASIHIEVRENKAPIAVISVNEERIEVDEEVVFDGSGSTDTDGAVKSFFFDYGDGSDSGWSLVSSTRHKYTQLGSYNATLRVKDSHGLEGTVSEGVNIIVGKAPVAILVAEPRKVVTGERVLLDGSVSTDEDGIVVLYRFTFGDGNSSDWTDRSTIEHAFTNAGSFEVILEVRDDQGYTSRNPMRVRIIVEDPENGKGQSGGSELAMPMIAIIVILAILMTVIVIVVWTKAGTRPDRRPETPAVTGPNDKHEHEPVGDHEQDEFY